MLILLPASERKRAIRRGKPVDPASLSFPSLAPTRAAVLDALIDVSTEHDGSLREAPTAPAEAVYGGVLYDALGLADLDAASRRRARAWVVIISALWGAVKLGDRIPPYRLNMCGRLPGLAHLTDVWRAPLDGVLPAAARRGLVVDLRSSEYLTAWRPSGELAERTVLVKVVRVHDGERGAASHSAKYTRGLLVRRIVTDAIDPRRPEDLAGALSNHFELDLRPPSRRGRSWEVHVVEPLAVAS